MRLLIANACLGGRTGSEVHTKDLALALQCRGHRCAVFVGYLREDDDVRSLRSAGVVVTDDLKDIPWVPEVIHGHHVRETVQACQAFPRIPAIQVCHDATHERDRAAKRSCVQQWGAVDGFCQERFARETGLKLTEIPVIFNPVDLKFIPERPLPPPSRPRRAALFFSSIHTPQTAESIANACGRVGISLDVIGPGTPGFVTNPGLKLPEYDLVFGKARCAIEAMASGAHIILCAPEGIGPRITPDNFLALRHRNFGRSLLEAPLSQARIEERIGELESSNTAALTKLIRTHNSTEALASLVEGIHLKLAKISPKRDALTLWPYYTFLRLSSYFSVKTKKAKARLSR